MAVFCVRTDSREFKDKAKSLGISEGQLENILHEYGNSEALQARFSEDDFILAKLRGISPNVSSEVIIKAWNELYSMPITFDNIEDYKAALDTAKSVFGDEAVGRMETQDGKYIIQVAEPFDHDAYQREIDEIRNTAIDNGTFMKAPNGNPTNLTERQWLQVRTKAFKKWFGDWENDPENASKVVDKNGEPLVVHHGTPNGEFSVFSYDYIHPDDGFYFAEDEERADTFTYRYVEGTNPYLFDVFLNIKNPMDLGDDVRHETVRTAFTTGYVQGSDGVMGLDSGTDKPVWVVMRPNQIKSADKNRGSFSRENNDIAMFTLNESSGETVTKGKLGVNKEQLITLLGSTMYQSGRQEVAVKELMQNAFDAVKIAKSQGRISRGRIDVEIDSSARTVKVSDNGTGMTPEIVQKAFFTIGGSYKGENVDSRLKSGGLGLAKMAFLFGSEYVDVTTVKDNVRTHVRATPEEIQRDDFDIVTSRTIEPNGTTVEVKIPEYYTDPNGEQRNIYFSVDPSFLDKPMLGDVDVNVKTISPWRGLQVDSYDKSKLPDGYSPIGKATTAFGDIEIYIAPDDNYAIQSDVLISGLHQFNKTIHLKGNERGRFKAIVNILPSVGVTDQLYPMNNQREGFRSTVNAEVEDLEFLLKRINNILEKKSIAQAFRRTISMDAAEVADIKRQPSQTKEEIFNDTRAQILKEFGKAINGLGNTIDWSSIRTQKVASEKARRSSFDASNIHLEEEEMGAVDTSNLKLDKPIFHNNTTMEIEADGQEVIQKLGELMLELKSLYIQAYRNAGIQAYDGSNITDYISKQYWGISFDKGYGGVNVSPKIMNMLAVNPFYKITQYEGVDTALALTEYLTHLIIHEFNHNYRRDESSGFTGRFPQTYGEFAGIGKQFNKDWKNKLYLLIKDNLQTFTKYASRYQNATNISESFKGSSLTEGVEGQESSIRNDGRNIQGNTIGENVQGHGEEFDSLTDAPNQESKATFNPEGHEFYSENAIDSDRAWSDTEEEPTVNGIVVSTKNARKFQRALTISKGVDTLYDNEIGLTENEITDECRKITYWVSDKVTEIQLNPEVACNDLFGLAKTNDWATEKDKQDDIDAISKLSRRDIIAKIGLQKFKDAYKKEIFEDNAALDDLQGRELTKATLLSENVNVLFELGLESFAQNEGYKIRHNDSIGADELTEGTQLATLTEDGIIDIAELAEMGTNLEDWMVDKTTVDVLGTASALLRSALSQGYMFDKNGKIKIDYLGRPERLSQNDAVKSIVRWVQGSQNIDQMIQKLSDKAGENPWLNQIITRLSDRSGNEADFIGQFYTTFQKHFQLFDTIKKNDSNQYYSFEVNDRPALEEAIREVRGSFAANQSPLFTTIGFNQTNLSQFRDIVARLSNVNNLNVTEQQFNQYKNGYVNRISAAANLLGYMTNEEEVGKSLNYGNFKDAITALSGILTQFEAERESTGTYKPFDYSRNPDSHSVYTYLKKFLSVVTESVENTVEPSFYEAGKLRQSYQIPSYATKLFGKLSGEEGIFRDTLNSEYGPFEWFYNKGMWRNSFLKELATMKDSVRRQVLVYKRNLNFMGDQYMRGLSPERYALSVLTEFGRRRSISGRQLAFYRFPIQSNAATSDFVSFYRYTGDYYKSDIIDGLMLTFGQELSRIQTVIERNRTSKDSDYIANFDGARGRQFCFLDFLNNLDALVSKDFFTKENAARLNELIREKVAGKESAELHVDELDALARKAIESGMNVKTIEAIRKFADLGITGAIRRISGAIDRNNGISIDQQTNEFIENFVWNDTLAAINITQLLVTDLAYYESSDDFQKRFKQVHSPGIRGNKDAIDYRGIPVSDGFIRVSFLNDFEDYKTNIIDNLTVIFNRNINQAPDNLKSVYSAVKEDVLRRMSKINVTDGQAFSSPTSVRKKGFMFGQWSKENEEVYNRLVSGNYTLQDIITGFNVKKPFIYTQLSQNVATDGTPLSNLKVPTQIKDSEYMLVMAGALLQNAETGRPNLLKILYEVMEESAFTDSNGTVQRFGISNGRGIDGFAFSSAVKSGLVGTSDIVNKWAKGEYNGSVSEAEQALKNQLLSELYVTDTEGNIDRTKYNEFLVKSIPVEDYSIQNDVPLHMLDERVIWSSQMRAILESNLSYADYNGNPVLFTWTDSNGNEYSVGRDEFKRLYEENARQLIQLHIQEVRETLGLDGAASPVDTRIAIADELQSEIRSNIERYGVDMLLGCIVDETGQFRIPPGDATQHVRIEQLINSIIKKKINKPKVDGGMGVQVSNIGTSRQLQYRFFQKDGKTLLPTREEWLKTNPDGDYEAYCSENQGGLAYEENYSPVSSRDFYNFFTDINGNVDIEAVEMLDEDLLFSIDERTPTEFYYSIAVAKDVEFMPKEAGDGFMRPYEITETDDSDFDVDKKGKWKLKASVKKNKNSVTARKLISIVPELSAMDKRAANEIAHEFLFDTDKFQKSSSFESHGKTLSNKDSKITRELFRAMKAAWIKEQFSVVYPTTGEGALLNNAWRMSKAVLQHDSSASKILTPGGNSNLSRLGYMSEVIERLGYDYDDAKGLTDKELKGLVKTTDLNTMFFLNQMEYYQRNNDASSNLGIFAVAATSHNLLEGNGFGLVNKEEFTIAGKHYGEFVEMDVMYDDEGTLVSKSLGENVSGAADAAKVPSHAYLNINNNTINEYLVLLRTGLPEEKAAMFISTTPLKMLVRTFNSTNIERRSTTFESLVKNRINKLRNGIDKNSPLEREELTWDEIKEAKKGTVSAKTELKILLTFSKLSKLAEGMREITFPTRFNSVASAVGPQIIDNHMFNSQWEGYRAQKEPKLAARFDTIIDVDNERKRFGDTVVDNANNEIVITPENMNELVSMGLIAVDTSYEGVTVDAVLSSHPMLNAFSQGYSIADEVFSKLNMPLVSNNFKAIINNRYYKGAFMRNRELLSKFSDFYLSYILLQSGVVNANEENYYIKEFPAKFLETKRKMHLDNKLVSRIKPRVVGDVVSLELNTTGMKSDERTDLQSAWSELFSKDPKLALDLFKYNYWRGGLGYSPKTFMNLLPMRAKEKIAGYISSFRDAPSVAPNLVLDQFFRNNVHNDNIVRPVYNSNKRGNVITFSAEEYDRMADSPFIKIIDDFGNAHLYKVFQKDSVKRTLKYVETTALGNNGEFLEISLGDIVQSRSTNTVKNATPEVAVEGKQDAEMAFPARERTDEEITSEAQEYVNYFKLSGGEYLVNPESLFTFAVKVKQENRGTSPEFVADQKARTKALFDRLGVTYNEDKINEILKALC